MIIQQNYGTVNSSGYQISIGQAGDITLSRSETTKITLGFKPKMILFGTANIYQTGASNYGILGSYNETLDTTMTIVTVFNNGGVYGTYKEDTPVTSGTTPQIYTIDNDGFTVCAVSTTAYPIDNFWWYAIG